MVADGASAPGEHIALFAPVLNDSGVARVMVNLAGAFAARGLAHPFGAPLETGERPPLREAGEVAAKIRALWGMAR